MVPRTLRKPTQERAAYEQQYVRKKLKQKKILVSNFFPPC